MYFLTVIKGAHGFILPVYKYDRSGIMINTKKPPRGARLFCVFIHSVQALGDGSHADRYAELLHPDS